MMHHNRRWVVTTVATAEELAEKLTQHTWTCCTGFALSGYLWLNDATCSDGAQEFSVVKRDGPRGRPVQIESITFSWCNYDQALAFIQHTLRGNDDNNDFAFDVTPTLETPEEHDRCRNCA